jgi:hypothetical protein
MDKKNEQGGGTPPAGADLAWLETLPTLSKEQLLEIAKEKGIEIAPELENEAIIKAITDYVNPPAILDEQQETPTDPPNEAGGTTPPATPGETPPASGGDKPPATPSDGKKRKVKCEALKGKSVNIGNGEIAQVDASGVFEVGEKEAARLLTIPGYEEA